MCAIELEMLITYNPFVVRDDQTLREAIRMFEENGFHHAPVVDGQRRLCGVISDGELLRAALQQGMIAAEAADRQSIATLAGRPIADFMTRRVVTAQTGDTAAEVIGRMLAHRIHSLPLVEPSQSPDEGPRLTGIITSSDIVREFAYSQLELASEVVRDYLEVIEEPLEPHASLSEADRHFESVSSNYAVVMQSDCPLGVITRREVRRAQTRHVLREWQMPPAAEPTVRSLLESRPHVAPGATLAEAAAAMAEHALNAMAVVSGASKLLGILTEDRLLQELAAAMRPASTGLRN